MTILRCENCGFAADFNTREDEGPIAPYSVAGFTKIDGVRPRRLTRETQRLFYDGADCVGYVFIGDHCDYDTAVVEVYRLAKKGMLQEINEEPDPDRKKYLLHRLKTWEREVDRILRKINKAMPGAKVISSGPLFGDSK